MSNLEWFGLIFLIILAETLCDAWEDRRTVLRVWGSHAEYRRWRSKMGLDEQSGD
jgi:hypothetical protein